MTQNDKIFGYKVSAMFFWRTLYVHCSTALFIMILWGGFSEFLVDLNGNGKLWLFIENWYNPVFITINNNSLTIIPQLIWFVAPILYYFTVLKCLSKKI